MPFTSSFSSWPPHQSTSDSFYYNNYATDMPKSPSFIKPRPLKAAPRHQRKSMPLPTLTHLRLSRAANVSLLLLLLTAVYFFLFTPPDPWSSNDPTIPSKGSRILPVQPSPHFLAESKPKETPRLSPAESLAALTAYILSPLHLNSLPPHAHAEDIQIEDFLEFGLTSSRSSEMVRQMVKETWKNDPVVVFGKFRHGPTRQLKALLKTSGLPKPTFIELDMRQDGVALERLLEMVVLPTQSTSFGQQISGNNNIHEFQMGSWELPLLIVGGTPIVGGIERIQDLLVNTRLDGLITTDH